MRKILSIFVLLLLTGCSTQKNIEYVDREIVRYVTQIQHDTIRESSTDSVYVELTTKGDTVYLTRYKEKTRWRDRIVEHYDTLWRDSIKTEYRESVKEVRNIPKIYKISMGVSILLLILAITKLFIWLKEKSII